MQLKDVLDKEILSLNEDNFQKLKEMVDKDKATWVLGAGISVPAGLPDWNTLLAKMWARLSEIDPGTSTKAGGDANAFVKARQNKLDQIKNYAGFQKKVKEACEGKGENIFSEINVLESAEYMWNYIGDLIYSDLGADARKELQKQILKELVRDSLSITKNIHSSPSRCIKNC